MEKQQGITDIPKAIKNILRPDEYVIVFAQQSRAKSLVTPDSIFVTNLRVIHYSPSLLGLRKATEDYMYVDMANFKVQKGIMLAKISIRMRYSSDDLIIDNLPKNKIDSISRVINEGIRRGTHEANIQPVPKHQVPDADSEDPLKVLKLRLAKGEITKEEFEEMKQLL